MTQVNRSPTAPGTRLPLPCLQLLLMCQGHTTLFAQLSQFCSTIHLHLGNSHVRKSNITNTNYILFLPNPAPSQCPISHIRSLRSIFHLIPHIGSTTKSRGFNLLNTVHIHLLLSIPMATTGG